MTSPVEDLDDDEDCEECKERIEEVMISACNDCGPASTREQLRLVLVGMDAVALFPSLTGKRTGKIVRERIRKTSLKFSGFNWKKAMIYLKINKHLVSGFSKKKRW